MTTGHEDYPYLPLDQHTPNSRTSAAAWVCGGIVVGGLLTLCLIILATPSSSWSLPACEAGWTELNNGCITWDSTPVEYSQATQTCGGRSTLIPRIPARQLVNILRVATPGFAANNMWIRGDGIKTCLQLSTGDGGVSQTCDDLALCVCYYPRDLSGFAQIAIAVRRTLNLS
ncbi:membrane protein [Macropodid alphaherpesvirus 1]|uniref:Membrane protein n=1 Tax=Macropodid alphaherpesvirus 1 TaxID=137443 RepID=A0A0Y0A759_9ALPH|nr:membrane protein [Macropodid alphaherpesvirus 1]AMB17057.1 membrane protein [Macropodid alphaherpesvirus 1]